MPTHCSRLRVCGQELPDRNAECAESKLHVREPTPLEVSYADDLANTVERWFATGMDATSMRLALANYRAIRSGRV